MLYRGALFDLDGTLLNTLDDLADSMNEALASLDMPAHPADAYRFFVGDGMLNLARRAAPAGTPEPLVKEIVHRMDEAYARNWKKKTRPYAGIPEMLEKIKEKGVRLAVLSNKPDHFTNLIIRHYFGEELFAIVFGARDGIPRKPDPAAALEIAAFLELPPASMAYFGDSNTDMRTGLAAGMRTIGVVWGFRPAQELLNAGADDIIARPEQAIAFFERRANAVS